MNKNLFLCLVVTIISAPASLASQWSLVWADEFGYSGPPDPNKWTYEVGFVRNRELQYYTKARRDNARVENGTLIIEARKEQFKNPNYDPDARRKSNWNLSRQYADYTSTSLTTLGKAGWCYGRIEVRAKLPTGKGTWPAIWTLGTNIKNVGWPACGEIDIMENVGFDPDRIHANIHTRKYNHIQNTQKGSSTNVSQPFKAFHVYAIEWSADRIDFYVDDHKYFTYENERSGEAAWPFDKEQYLILNTAIGGSWGGQKGIDDSIFPQKFYIDYVRVYQKRTTTTKALEKERNLPAQEITNSVGMKLRYIQPGEFVMGSPDNEKGREEDESPPHPVKLTRGFYMSVTEVTQGQWAKVMKTRPWAENANITKGDDYPAVYVKWADAVDFCTKLGQHEGRTYRLPTEAEWEYACRAGTKTQFYWGTEFDQRYAWSSTDKSRSIHEVAGRLPNAWGLFDMGGNVWEWCSDWHGNYPAGELTDPKGPEQGIKRVIRSGSYSNSPYDCRSAERGAAPPDDRYGGIGFRVVLETPDA